MHITNESDALYQALSEPSRRAILKNLRFGSKSVSQIVAATNLKQPNVSNHLAKMKQQGIVGAERIGRCVHYFLATPYAEVLLRTHEFVANATPQSSDFSASPPISADSDAPGASPHTKSILHAESDFVPAAGRPHLSADANRSDDNCPPIAKQSKRLRKKTINNGVGLEPTVRGNSEANGTDVRISLWRSRYLDSLLRGDEQTANALVNVMLAENGALETIYTHVFGPALNMIGDMWERGEIDEAHEHHASAITERMMARVAHFRTPVMHTRHTALLGCVVDNWHSFGLRMLADGLREIGWDTVFLGANVPAESFIRMAAAKRPDLIVISCAMETQIDAARELILSLDSLRSADGERNFQIVVGGNGLSVNRELPKELPVDFTAEDLSHFLSIVRSRFPAPSQSPRNE